jgi:hypothetical protein
MVECNICGLQEIKSKSRAVVCPRCKAILTGAPAPDEHKPKPASARVAWIVGFIAIGGATAAIALPMTAPPPAPTCRPNVPAPPAYTPPSPVVPQVIEGDRRKEELDRQLKETERLLREAEAALNAELYRAESTYRFQQRQAMEGADVMLRGARHR